MVLTNKIVLIMVILVIIKVDNSVASPLPMIQKLRDSASEGCTIVHDHYITQDFSLASESNNKDEKLVSSSTSETSLSFRIPLPPWDVLAVMSLLVLFFLGFNNVIVALPAIIIISAVAYQFNRLQNN
ncbi:PREDICTED: uncharacterized protein LOC109345198 [Lupinus angustifolius]|uniref:uncharacterized protein LOC109345198 n=1 Tax=Lupinus angustifolius TaxID=3871 RepID=UPI00092EBC9C|nr:PREDICTED: uncharacterized protein LOC109345198 [Lupinus angustifolius]